MSETFHNVVKIISMSFKVDEAAINELRAILEDQNKNKISYDEAEKIGRSLITVIETLANGRTITIDRKHNAK